MFAETRIKKIKEILLEYKHIDGQTLSSLLSVSMNTVRRDLDKLESENFLKKTHGGAVLVEENFEVQLNDIEDPFKEEKRQVAAVAAGMIEDHDIIYLGQGFICLEIAKRIKERSALTVVTNNINALVELAANPQIRVIVPGGELRVEGNVLELKGRYSLNNLKKMLIGKVFVPVSGVTVDPGYTCDTEEEVELYQELCEKAEEIVFLADYTRFGERSLCYLGPVDMADKVVTNAQVPSTFKEYFDTSGVTLFTAFPET